MWILVPPDNACSKLPEVENGAVVYSDLNLGAGCVAHYVCNEGYTLQSIRGQKEFVCDEYGIWNGDTTSVPVECLCKFPVQSLHIPYYHRNIYIPNCCKLAMV